jgi:hypothetical protein
VIQQHLYQSSAPRFLGLKQLLSTSLASSFVLPLLVTTLLVGPVSSGYADPLKGSVTQSQGNSDNFSINPDDVKHVEKGTLLEMTVSTELTPGINIEGDEFYGKVTKDYLVDGKVVIPRDTIIHGLIQEMKDPKRAGRNGYITSKFDYMITPDGREIPIDGGHTTKDKPLVAAAKVVGRGAGYSAVGGVAGALMVLRYGGLAAVAASNGYALAGGAAVGGAVGLTAAMLTKGSHAMIQPGAELKIKLSENLDLPSVNVPDPAANDQRVSGLDVKVLGFRVSKDPFGEENEMTLSLDLTNQTENTFTFFDIALEDETGAIHYASPFGDTGLWFQKLKPNTHLSGNMTFNVDNAKLRHTLVFYRQYTREPMARIALTGAMDNAKKKKAVSQQTNKSKQSG